uniref:2-phosphoxylose phosphatase 1 n=1 Tax=Arion vulgaris TaxID=1028688 RepID=A0A0B7ABB1_9EUPU
MYKRVKQTSLFALGVGTLGYLYHRRHPIYTVLAEGNHNETTKISSNQQGSSLDRPALLSQNIPDQQPELKLRQVLVMFRHGARTPIHLIPKIPEVNYDSQFLLRDHQASLFPFERVYYSSPEKMADWSNYELKYAQSLLTGGVPSGVLTSYGKDQMFVLGKKLQRHYRDQLDMSTYNPQDTLVLSSNIKRTVQSAQCVLAGFFGKEELNKFAKNHSPVKIYVTDKKYNILVPDTDVCTVLRKANHIGMFDSDTIPGFKSDRLAVEKQINDEREKNIEVVKEIQYRIDQLCGTSGIDSCYRAPTSQINNHHQPYVRDAVLHPLIEERSRAIQRVGRLWPSAMSRNANLAQVITQNDMKALVYLNRLEVERLGGGRHSGYRFHFYFDPNPYFYNEHLCKEVYSNKTQGALSSLSVPIIWKQHGKMIEAGINERNNACQCQVTKDGQNKNVQTSLQESNVEKQRQPCTCDRSEMSFFQWYLKPTFVEHDQIGKTIRDEVWTSPVKYLEGKTKFPDRWDRNFNFVFVRDDLIARVTHGLSYPTDLAKFDSMITDRAITMLYCAMAGHCLDKRVVARLCAGPLLTAMVDESHKVINGKQQARKLCLYSSHDSTMCGMLELLEIGDNKWPPFAADLRFEIYQDVNNADYYVRVLYCGKVQRILGQKEDLLRWSDFMKVAKRCLIHENEYRDICTLEVNVQQS